MPQWIHTILLELLDSSLRISLIAGCVAAILAVNRTRSSSVRHAAWTSVLLVMLFFPLLRYCVPSISVTSRNSAAAIFPAPVPLPADNRAVSLPNPTSSNIAAEQAVLASVPPAHVSVLPMIVVIIIYAAGILLLLSRLIIGWFAMKQIGGGSLPILQGVNLPVYASPLVVTPMTIGVIFPKIILPSTWTAWPEEKLQAVLAHEAAHVRRRDPLIGFLARVNCSLFWFHPLAWWLERKLAATAEHACDDAAVLTIGQPQQYAEVLLDMAQAMRRKGGRLRWQGIGVGGNGSLGERIDRILRNEALPHMSAIRKVMVGLSCLSVSFLVVACTQEPRPSIEEEQQALARYEANRFVFEQSRFKSERFDRIRKSAESLTPQGVLDSEAHLMADPDDFATREKLLYFYSAYFKRKPEANTEDLAAARRPHVLWLIQHYPDYQYPALFVIAADDPTGYAEAKTLWLSQSARSDVTGIILSNAAYFFEELDRPLSEQMLLRARMLEPAGPWIQHLARLYALSILGAVHAEIPSIDSWGGLGFASTNVTEAHNAFAENVRKKLAATKDDVLLSIVAQNLSRNQYAHLNLDFDVNALATSYFQRAFQLNPKSVPAQYALFRVRTSDRLENIRKNLPKDHRYEAVSALPDKDRFDLLWQLAEFSYSYGRSWDEFHRDNAVAAWDESRRYAADLVQLAPRFRSSPEYGAALLNGNLLLGFVAAEKGDRAAALQYLRAATKAPELNWMPTAPWERLCSILIDAGDRDTVVDFLEHLAQIAPWERDNALASAAEIRNGKIPHWYRRDA